MEIRGDIFKRANEMSKTTKTLTETYQEAARRQVESEENVIVKLKISSLIANYDNHWSKMYNVDKEKWEEFLNSIKSNGIHTPIIVRPVDDEQYEIIAGHNRVEACEQLGIDEVPAIVKKLGEDDLEEIVAIRNDTNLQREEVSDLEKGWAYRELYEAINRNGNNQYSTKNAFGHEDQMQNLNGENAFGHEDQMQSKISSYEVIAEKYGIGEKTVRRKIRLTYLINPLYILFEKKKITQAAAEQLSYLKLVEQAHCEFLINEKGLVLTEDIAKEIRKASEASVNALSDVAIQSICGGEAFVKKDKSKKVKSFKFDDSLFPAGLKDSQKQKYVEDALRYILENKIEISKREAESAES